MKLSSTPSLALLALLPAALFSQTINFNLELQHSTNTTNGDRWAAYARLFDDAMGLPSYAIHSHDDAFRASTTFTSWVTFPDYSAIEPAYTGNWRLSLNWDGLNDIPASGDPDVWSVAVNSTFSGEAPGELPVFTSHVHNQTGVSTTPTFEWTGSLVGWDAVRIGLYPELGGSVYSQEFVLGETSWTPPELMANTRYMVDILYVKFNVAEITAGVPENEADPLASFPYDFVFKADFTAGEYIVIETGIPEPSSWSAIVGASALGLVALRRRRR